MGAEVKKNDRVFWSDNANLFWTFVADFGHEKLQVGHDKEYEPAFHDFDYRGLHFRNRGEIDERRAQLCACGLCFESCRGGAEHFCLRAKQKTWWMRPRVLHDENQFDKRGVLKAPRKWCGIFSITNFRMETWILNAHSAWNFVLCACCECA